MDVALANLAHKWSYFGYPLSFYSPLDTPYYFYYDTNTCDTARVVSLSSKIWLCFTVTRMMNKQVSSMLTVGDTQESTLGPEWGELTVLWDNTFTASRFFSWRMKCTGSEHFIERAESDESIQSFCRSGHTYTSRWPQFSCFPCPVRQLSYWLSTVHRPYVFCAISERVMNEGICRE